MFTHITEIKQVLDMFTDIQNNKVSGPTGMTAEHIRHAPDEVLKALIPLINDMIDGNYSPITLLGVLVPLSKNLERFRPIHLLEIVYRAVDRHITKHLLNAISTLKLVPPNQFGSIIGGSSTSPIDIMVMIAEDAQFHDRTAWVNLLDCSEAFDSMNDAITDIILAHTGLPDKFILWTRRATQNQKRLILTAGGISDIHTFLNVRGCSQGAPSCPPKWGITTGPIFSLSSEHGGAGYQPHGAPEPNQQVGFVDDNAVSDEFKEGSTFTSQFIIFMQSVLNIRVQGTKSIALLSTRAFNDILHMIRQWNDPRTTTPPPLLVHLFVPHVVLRLFRGL